MFNNFRIIVNNGVLSQIYAFKLDEKEKLQVVKQINMIDNFHYTNFNLKEFYIWCNKKDKILSFDGNSDLELTEITALPSHDFQNIASWFVIEHGNEHLFVYMIDNKMKVYNPITHLWVDNPFIDIDIDLSNMTTKYTSAIQFKEFAHVPKSGLVLIELFYDDMNFVIPVADTNIKEKHDWYYWCYCINGYAYLLDIHDVGNGPMAYLYVCFFDIEQLNHHKPVTKHFICMNFLSAEYDNLHITPLWF
jgi:hypothetical protein